MIEIMILTLTKNTIQIVKMVQSDAYRNRKNKHVLKRNIARMGEILVDSIKEGRRAKVESQRRLHGPSLTDIACEADRLRGVARTKRTMDRLGEMVSVFQERAGQLKANSMSTLAILNQLLARPVEIFKIDPDRCSECGTVAVFDSTVYRAICSNCMQTWSVLSIIEDVSSDTIVFKSSDKIGKSLDTARGSICTFINTVDEAGMVLDSPSYDRSPLYARYLRQFSAVAEAVPMSVMKIIYSQMVNVHLMASVRCRPTPIASILRSNAMHAYVHQSIRITKLFNGEPVPKLPEALIEALVHRFRVVSMVTGTFAMGKLPPFAILTHVFLRMEGQQRLANGFETHKTSAVLSAIETKFRPVINKCQEMDEDRNWCIARLF